MKKRKFGKLGVKEHPLIGQILNPVETTQYRALAATAKFLAIDRGDIVYCAKELTHHMATPTTADWEKMVRLERYLNNRPRVQLWYKIQETPCQLEMWCKTQAVVALSSAEAELYGSVRASAETMDSSRCTKTSAHT